MSMNQAEMIVDRRQLKKRLFRWRILAVLAAFIALGSFFWSGGDKFYGWKIALDDSGGSGVESLTYSGNGAQTFPEETLSVKEIPFTFPHPSTASVI